VFCVCVFAVNALSILRTPLELAGVKLVTKPKPTLRLPSTSTPQQALKAPTLAKSVSNLANSDLATPTSKVTRPTTPIDTCKLPTVSCEDDYDNVGGLDEEVSQTKRALEKRGGTRDFKVDIGASVSSSIENGHW
jgi:hypothetical protein